jgi:hypothetical protein
METNIKGENNMENDLIKKIVNAGELAVVNENTIRVLLWGTKESANAIAKEHGLNWKEVERVALKTVVDDNALNVVLDKSVLLEVLDTNEEDLQNVTGLEVTWEN